MDDTHPDPQEARSPSGPAAGTPSSAEPPAAPPPNALPGAAPVALASAAPPDAIVSQLAQTAAWVRFMAIMGFIGIGFMGIVGLGILAFGFPGQEEAGFMRYLGLIYLALAAIYLIPVLPLNQFATEAARLKRNPSFVIAAEALRHNRSFWKRLGILSIIGLAFTVLSIFVAILVGVIAVMARA